MVLKKSGGWGVVQVVAASPQNQGVDADIDRILSRFGREFKV